MRIRMSLVFVFAIVSVCSFGCSTSRMSHTSRTGMEQLLISNAVDQVLNRFDFTQLAGASVFVEEKYLEGVDKGYLISSVRERLLRSGARLMDKVDESDVVVELRSGGIGTDTKDSYVGFPGITVPAPMPVELPEVRLWNRSKQMGTAKIGIVAYDTKSRQALNLGGQTLARSDDSNWYVMGLGPFQSGSVREEVHVATGAVDQMTLMR